MKNSLRKTAIKVFTGAAFAFATVPNAKAQIKDYATDPHLTPAVWTFLKAIHGAPGIEILSTQDAQASVKYDYSGVVESEKIINAEVVKVKLYIMRPRGVTGKLPVFIFVHGGGWILGDYPTHKRMVRDLVEGSGAVGVFVEYSRTPEVQYPVAVIEVYATTKWVAEHGDQINVDGKRLAIVGNSAGGNMAAVVSS